MTTAKWQQPLENVILHWCFLPLLTTIIFSYSHSPQSGIQTMWQTVTCPVGHIEIIQFKIHKKKYTVTINLSCLKSCSHIRWWLAFFHTGWTSVVFYVPCLHCNIAQGCGAVSSVFFFCMNVLLHKREGKMERFQRLQFGYICCLITSHNKQGKIY